MKIRTIKAKIALVIPTFMIPSSVFALELRTICGGVTPSTCNITIAHRKQKITNYSNINITSATPIQVNAPITDFINYSTITTQSKWSMQVSQSGAINNLINYNTISGGITTHNTSVNPGHGTGSTIYYGNIGAITNYGTMGGMEVSPSTIINNFGTINLIDSNNTKAHFHNVNPMIKNYAITINKMATAFNNNTAPADNSHIVINNGRLNFADLESKIILDFGKDFELDKGYSIKKLVVNPSGADMGNIAFSRLTTRSSLYKLTEQDGNFIASIDSKNSEIGILHKANIHTINAMTLFSNAVIYPRKSDIKSTKKRSQPTQKRTIRRAKRVSNLFYDAPLSKQSTSSPIQIWGGQ